jgi:hypothetical protein
MRNELYLSNEVALDGSSWHSCCFDEEAYPRALQASENVTKGAESRQMTLALVIHAEGEDASLKSSLGLPMPPSVSC